tara:strand:- start:102 stop:518 length:417 start_codon:yes stop_codon:yes gene_type:complete
MKKNIIYLTRRERFSSAHKLENKNLSLKENEEIFGKCLTLHGHNYELFVTVKGQAKEKDGFVCDLKKLSSVLKKHVINKLDHQFINEVDFMKGKISSTENLCIGIWQELDKVIYSELNCQLHCVKVYETENNIFEYFG